MKNELQELENAIEKSIATNAEMSKEMLKMEQVIAERDQLADRVEHLEFVVKRLIKIYIVDDDAWDPEEDTERAFARITALDYFSR